MLSLVIFNSIIIKRLLNLICEACAKSDRRTLEQIVYCMLNAD